MNERIILAPDVNESELLRAMARWGNKAFGLGTRVMNGAALAEKALICSGVEMPDDLLGQKDAVSLLYTFLLDDTDEEDYFSHARTYQDAENIYKSLTLLRKLIEAPTREQEWAGLQAWRDGESQQAFAQKNQDLLKLYAKYRQACEERHLMDQTDLIRLALEKADRIRGELWTIREFPLSPLELALARKLAGGNIKEAAMEELLGGKGRTAPQAHRFFAAYGAVNEIEHILEDIYKDENGKLDDCLIAVTGDAGYVQTLLDLTERYHIPATFGMGIPLRFSGPGQLLKA